MDGSFASFAESSPLTDGRFSRRAALASLGGGLAAAALPVAEVGASQDTPPAGASAGTQWRVWIGYDDLGQEQRLNDTVNKVLQEQAALGQVTDNVQINLQQITEEWGDPIASHPKQIWVVKMMFRSA